MQFPYPPIPVPSPQANWETVSRDQVGVPNILYNLPKPTERLGEGVSQVGFIKKFTKLTLLVFLTTILYSDMMYGLPVPPPNSCTDNQDCISFPCPNGVGIPQCKDNACECVGTSSNAIQMPGITVTATRNNTQPALITTPINPPGNSQGASDPADLNACQATTNRADKWCTGNLASIGGSAGTMLSTILPELGQTIANNDMKGTCNVLKGTTIGSTALNGYLLFECWRAISACKRTCNELATSNPEIKGDPDFIASKGRCEELTEEKDRLLAQTLLNGVNIKRMFDSCKQMEDQNANQEDTAALGNLSPEDCRKQEHFRKPVCECYRNPSLPICKGMDNNINPFEDLDSQFGQGGSGDVGINSLLAGEEDFSGGDNTGGGGGPPGGGGGGFSGGGGGGGSDGGGEGQASNGDPGYDTDIVGGTQSAGGGGGGGGSSGGGGYQDGTSNRASSSGLGGLDPNDPSFLDLKKFLPGGEKAKDRNIASINGKANLSSVSKANGESNFQKVTRAINEKRGILLP